MRIVSLLPSATEIAFALGLGDDVVGVTHECNWPPEALDKPRVSRTLLPPDASPAEIDALVTAANQGGDTKTEELDEVLLRELDPDLVLTQDLCAVCAVPAGDVEAALDTIGCRANVLSLDPGSLDEVLDDIRKVGEATNRRAEADAVVARLAGRLAAVRASVEKLGRPRVVALEWGDPPYNAGHWIPEMIETAGGVALLAKPRVDSVPITWAQIEQAAPEVVVFMPCGYSLAAAVAEGAELLKHRNFGTAQVWAVAADSLFVRPGPRLVDGVETLASILHPELAPPASGAAQKLDG